MAHTEIEISEVPTAVYRFYDSDDVLLYVGITGNLANRWANHAADKYWWLHVARKTVVMYPSRAEAAAEEDRAILEESPVHNIAGRKEKLSQEEQVVFLERQIEKSRAILERQQRIFELDERIMSWVDECAERRQCSREAAVVELLFAGMMKHYADLQAGHEERVAKLRAMEAAGVASGNVGIAR